MVCQKSRERKEQKVRSLPPKKRAINRSKTIEVDGVSSSQSQTSSEASKPTVANVSSDERSVSSSGNSSANATSMNSDISEGPPASILSGPSRDSSGVPFISNDPRFVSNALRQRDNAETLRAAKAMLYDAYMKAVRKNESPP